MIKIGVIVGGAANIDSVGRIRSLFQKSGVRIKAIDILGTDIDAIIKASDRLDYVFLDRNSSISTRLRLIQKIHRLNCNMIMFQSPKKGSWNKTKFFNLYENSKENTQIINDILLEKCNTHLRRICSSKESKLKYKFYLFQQFLNDTFNDALVYISTLFKGHLTCLNK